MLNNQPQLLASFGWILRELGISHCDDNRGNSKDTPIKTPWASNPFLFFFLLLLKNCAKKLGWRQLPKDEEKPSEQPLLWQRPLRPSGNFPRQHTAQGPVCPKPGPGDRRPHYLKTTADCPGSYTEGPHRRDWAERRRLMEKSHAIC